MRHWGEMIPTDKRDIELYGEELNRSYGELNALELQLNALKKAIREKESALLIACHKHGMSTREVNRHRNAWIEFEYPHIKAVYPNASFLSDMYESAMPIVPNIKDDLPPGASTSKK